MLTGCSPVIYKALPKALAFDRPHLLFIYKARHVGLCNKPKNWQSGKNKAIVKSGDQSQAVCMESEADAVSTTGADGRHTFKYCNYSHAILNGFGWGKAMKWRPDIVKASLKTEICHYFITELLNWKRYRKNLWFNMSFFTLFEEKKR